MPSPSTSRRAFLGATATGFAALAGCESLRPDSDRRVEYTLYVEEHGDSLADELLWKPPEPDDDRPGQTGRREAWEAATTGEAYRTYGYPAVPDGEYTEREGTYYQLHDVVSGSERIDRWVLRLSWVGRADDEETSEATPREALPELDQGAVMPAYFAARAERYGGGAPWKYIEQGGYVYRNADPAESELIPDPEHEYVSVHGAVLRVEVSRETLVEPEHTAVATQVATGDAAFERVADAAGVEVRLEPADFDAEAADLFERAQFDGGYVDTMPLATGFEDLLRTLGLHDALGCSVEKCESKMAETEYLAFDGSYYDAAVYVRVED
ncbi:hypothetical protein [Haloarcula marina]|uniref:hypothetical protein n=1 Tax=Haloarcula marina TaxID=2961574 RepID=UPI0020B6DD13|nr:hypothetical protein [Halomicroarcula marina]